MSEKWDTRLIDSAEAAADLRDRAHKLRDYNQDGSVSTLIAGYEIAAALHCIASALDATHQDDAA